MEHPNRMSDTHLSKRKRTRVSKQERRDGALLEAKDMLDKNLPEWVTPADRTALFVDLSRFVYSNDYIRTQMFVGSLLDAFSESLLYSDASNYAHYVPQAWGARR